VKVKKCLLTQAEISSNKDVVERIKEDVEEHNAKFGKWEQVKRFELTPEEWTIEAGHLTPTMKLKRKVIKEIYKDLYSKIYGHQPN